MSDYPKLMTRGTEEITVQHRAEQGDREADGFIACDGSVVRVPASVPEDVPAGSETVEEVSEPPTFGAADDGTEEGPTEGPASDDTHVKLGRKKK